MNVQVLEEEILNLRKLLQEKEERLSQIKDTIKNEKKSSSCPHVEKLPKWAIERYSRQSLVSELAPVGEATKTLMNASVLIVGAGGLGCPTAAFLAGAGLGHIGIVDHDEVDLSNIHRQILHSEVTVGMKKVESVAMALRRMNSNIRVTPYHMLINSSNALALIKEFDLVIDATDNVVTRYLLNDACVLSKKSLVSAAALKLEGQMTVYNYRSKDGLIQGPCLRCVFPEAPPPAAVGSCSQSGVVGPVTGIMGSLQALEAMHVLLDRPRSVGSLLLFDGEQMCFRKVKLRKRNPGCLVCSDNPKITELIDYALFCNSQATDKDLALNILSADSRISAGEYAEKIYPHLLENYKVRRNIISNCEILQSDDVVKGSSILLDVRSKGEFDMCKIEGSMNLPIEDLSDKRDDLVRVLKEKNINEIYFVCRRGNDSQLAVKELKGAFTIEGQQTEPVIKDIAGGLHAWAKVVDDNFPIY